MVRRQTRVQKRNRRQQNKSRRNNRRQNKSLRRKRQSRRKLRGGIMGLSDNEYVSREDIPNSLRPATLANIMRNMSRQDNTPLKYIVTMLENNMDIGGGWTHDEKMAAASILKDY